MKAVRFIGIGLSIAGIAYLLYVLLRSPADMRVIATEPAFYLAVTAAGLSILASLLLASLNWWLLLDIFAPGNRLLPMARIFLQTQVAKYLPGNVGHLIGRAAVLNSVGVPVPASAKAMVLEMTALLFAGGLLSAIFVGQWLRASIRDIPSGLALAAALIAVGCAIGAAASSRIRRPIVNSYRSILVSHRRLPAVLAINVANFALNGVALWTAATLLFPGTAVGYLTCLGVASASFLAGYITPGSPGGIGVREVTTIGLLAPFFTPDQGAAIALVVRLGAVASDLAGFALAAAMRTAR